VYYAAACRARCSAAWPLLAAGLLFCFFLIFSLPGKVVADAYIT